MLVLSRRPKESLRITFGERTLTVTVIEMLGNKIRLGFDGPRDIQVTRSELLPAREGPCPARKDSPGS